MNKDVVLVLIFLAVCLLISGIMLGYTAEKKHASVTTMLHRMGCVANTETPGRFDCRNNITIYWVKE